MALRLQGLDGMQSSLRQWSRWSRAAHSDAHLRIDHEIGTLFSKLGILGLISR